MMFNVGMFYDDKQKMMDEYRRHSQSVQNGARYWKTTSVNPKERTITTDDTRFMYFYMDPRDDNAINTIAGIEFQAVFSLVIDTNVNNYILTRFRPR